MTRNSNTKSFTAFANPQRQFRARKDTTPISVHKIYSFYEFEQSEVESEEMGEVDIETLTIEQYLALDHGDTRRGVRNPKIEGNVDFEIKVWILRELRDNTFSRNDNEDAHEHVGRILEITSLFNTPGVSRDAIIQEGKEMLYQAWERYNDLLFKCPTYDLNDYQKVNTFYKVLEISTRQMLDSRRPILELIATRALVSIQEIDDHSYKWQEKEGNRETGEYKSTRMSTITYKFKSLNRDMRNLKENVHSIKGKYESGDEMYYLSSEEVKCLKATEYREDSLMVTPYNNSPLGNNPKLEEILGKYLQ
ncbi:hypothetical protein Tco_0663570, partial [Tanacetum coccineum]